MHRAGARNRSMSTMSVAISSPFRRTDSEQVNLTLNFSGSDPRYKKGMAKWPRTSRCHLHRHRTFVNELLSGLRLVAIGIYGTCLPLNCKSLHKISLLTAGISPLRISIRPMLCRRTFIHLQNQIKCNQFTPSNFMRSC
jgi:hypothetical protein